MLKRFAIVALISVFCGQAVADDLLPPSWRLSNASATVQEWDFTTNAAVQAPDGSIWGSNGSGYVNPHGTPMQTNAQGTHFSSFGVRTGVWMLTLPTDEIKLFIPNDPGGMGVKSVYIQITWLDAQFNGPNVFLNSSSLNSQLSVDSATVLSDGWTHARYKVDFGPCPSSETITIKGFTAGAVMFVDQIVVDTICRPVPEPASMAALTLGSVWLVRSRRRRS